MKQLISVVLLLIIVFSIPILAQAETIDVIGNWRIMSEVDDFNMPTDNYFIANYRLFKGTFSDTAVMNKDVGVIMFIQQTTDSHQEYVQFRLFKYGNMIVDNVSSKTKTYDILMMDGEKNRYSFFGAMASQDQDIIIGKDDSQTVINAMRAGGTIRFSINSRENALIKYIYSFDASQFDEVYNEWKSK